MSKPTELVLQNEKIEDLVHQIEEGDKSEHDSHAGVNEDHLPEYRNKETQRILRKVDWHLIPLLTTLYVFSFLDRSNLGNAAIAGMNEDLNLIGHRYNV